MNRMIRRTRTGKLQGKIAPKIKEYWGKMLANRGSGKYE